MATDQSSSKSTITLANSLQVTRSMPATVQRHLAWSQSHRAVDVKTVRPILSLHQHAMGHIYHSDGSFSTKQYNSSMQSPAVLILDDEDGRQ